MGEFPQDYIFSYRLQGERDRVERDRLLQMVSAQLESLLDLIVLTEDGREVKIDGFKLQSDRETVHDMFTRPTKETASSSPPSGSISSAGHDFQDTRNASLYEPRIAFIQKQLENLLSVADLEHNGEVVKVDGFRLKALADWLVNDVHASDILEHLATRCGCDCVFCYNKGNPPSLALGNLKRPAEAEFEEAMTRVRYYSSPANYGLFPTLGCGYEVLVHPHCLEVLKLLRKKSAEPIRITTSGVTLTPEVVDRLPGLGPLYLYLSLNSASPARRRRLMRDPKPEVAIGALPLLNKRNIPYAAVIVPWPVDSLDEMLSDLSETVAYASEHQAHLIQVNLPGYSRYFSESKLFDLDQVWTAIISRVRDLMARSMSPIVVMPALYEENSFESDLNQARVLGLVRNSPAAFSGLRPGDILLEVNGLPVRSRPQARDVLSLLQKSPGSKVSLAVLRDSTEVKLVMDVADGGYPYSRDFDRHLGIIFLGGAGFRTSYLEGLKVLIDRRRAKRVLFLSSRLVRPIFERELARSSLFGDVTIDVQVPQDRFFGGNIFMGDLLVVQDFIDFIKEYLEANESRPDLIVIPSSPFSLGQWRRDLTGRSYLEIERAVKVPVELLECAPIYE